MLIAIEAERANTDHLTGVEQYAKQLILKLAEIDHNNEYILYLRTKPHKWILDLPKNFKAKVMPFPIFWTQLRISWEILMHKPDALFIMASALPLIHPRNSVVTIHDLAWDLYPETFGAFMLNYLRFSTWHACKFSRSVIAVSEQTKKDIIKIYHLPETKINVIYHGFEFTNEKQKNEKPLDLPQKFILYLGTLQPRKNILGLIDAYLQLRSENKIKHSLVLVGGKGWFYDQIMEKIQKHPEIIYLGYVQDRFEVLRKADLLVQPAFYEGFGMQILDAFAARVPAACSNVSSLPEVAGDAAVYFDPKNISEMKDAIIKALTDQNLRAELISKGEQRLHKFTWQKCAEQTLKVLTQSNA